MLLFIYIKWTDCQELCCLANRGAKTEWNPLRLARYALSITFPHLFIFAWATYSWRLRYHQQLCQTAKLLQPYDKSQSSFMATLRWNHDVCVQISLFFCCFCFDRLMNLCWNFFFQYGLLVFLSFLLSEQWESLQSRSESGKRWGKASHVLKLRSYTKISLY